MLSTINSPRLLINSSQSIDKKTLYNIIQSLFLNRINTSTLDPQNDKNFSIKVRLNDIDDDLVEITTRFNEVHLEFKDTVLCIIDSESDSYSFSNHLHNIKVRGLLTRNFQDLFIVYDPSRRNKDVFQEALDNDPYFNVTYIDLNEEQYPWHKPDSLKYIFNKIFPFINLIASLEKDIDAVKDLKIENDLTPLIDLIERIDKHFHELLDYESPIVEDLRQKYCHNLLFHADIPVEVILYLVLYKASTIKHLTIQESIKIGQLCFSLDPNNETLFENPIDKARMTLFFLCQNYNKNSTDEDIYRLISRCYGNIRSGSYQGLFAYTPIEENFSGKKLVTVKEFCKIFSEILFPMEIILLDKLKENPFDLDLLSNTISELLARSQYIYVPKEKKEAFNDFITSLRQDKFVFFEKIIAPPGVNNIQKWVKSRFSQWFEKLNLTSDLKHISGFKMQ